MCRTALPSFSSFFLFQKHADKQSHITSQRNAITMANNWATELFGPKILTKPKTTGLPTESRIGGKSGKKLVALYFSASW